MYNGLTKGCSVSNSAGRIESQGVVMPARGYVYTTGPLDWWTAWSTLDAVVQAEEPDYRDRRRAQLEQILTHAKLQVAERGEFWEGDIIQGPYFSGLPNAEGDADGEVMVGFKQMNNGTTYFWSPYRLGFLEES